MFLFELMECIFLFKKMVVQEHQLAGESCKTIVKIYRPHLTSSSNKNTNNNQKTTPDVVGPEFFYFLILINNTVISSEINPRITKINSL